MSPQPPKELDLRSAVDNEEIFLLAGKLARWALRNGVVDAGGVEEWLVSQPREDRLPRRSTGRLQATERPVRNAGKGTAEWWDPSARPEFDPEPLHALASRIAGSGVTHEKYLLGVIALCHRYETLTPTVTGRNLAEVVGVVWTTANDVLRTWSKTLAYGFFTGKTYDGVKSHGRVWTVDPEWVPVSKPKHAKGCNRARDRCSCGLSQNTLHIPFRPEQICSAKCDTPEQDDEFPLLEGMGNQPEEGDATLVDPFEHPDADTSVRSVMPVAADPFERRATRMVDPFEGASWDVNAEPSWAAEIPAPWADPVIGELSEELRNMLHHKGLA
ncbi:MAG: hypothetical protein JST91_08635 [Actinobacteria bacterium]|nr:hypothetical protein [Actinomycetota bacterium]